MEECTNTNKELFSSLASNDSCLCCVSAPRSLQSIDRAGAQGAVKADEPNNPWINGSWCHGLTDRTADYTPVTPFPWLAAAGVRWSDKIRLARFPEDPRLVRTSWNERRPSSTLEGSGSESTKREGVWENGSSSWADETMYLFSTLLRPVWTWYFWLKRQRYAPLKSQRSGVDAVIVGSKQRWQQNAQPWSAKPKFKEFSQRVRQLESNQLFNGFIWQTQAHGRQMPFYREECAIFLNSCFNYRVCGRNDD